MERFWICKGKNSYFTFVDSVIDVSATTPARFSEVTTSKCTSKLPWSSAESSKTTNKQTKKLCVLSLDVLCVEKKINVYRWWTPRDIVEPFWVTLC